MVTLSLSQWTQYRDILKKIDERAADEFRDGVWRIGGRFEAVGLGKIPAEDLINYAYELVTKYGEASAAVAAEMYDEIAALQKVDVPLAVPAPTATYHETAKMVNGILKTSQNVDMLAGGVSRLVKMAGTDTTLKNAHRDRKGRHKHTGAKVAWVPSGDTCPYCLMLASKGWQKQTVWGANNHSEHIHGNCDCTYMVRFDDDLEYEGYDPKVYEKMYKDAEGSTEEEKLNSMRRENYAENREKILEQKADAYEKRKELESSEAEEKDVN